MGAVTGAIVGVTATGLLLHADIVFLLRAAAIAVGGGLLAAALALVVPLARIGRLAPAGMVDQ